MDIIYTQSAIASGTINLYHKETLSTLFMRYRDNLMKSNAGNCPLLGSINGSIFMKTILFDVNNTSCEIPLAIKFDQRLTFDHQP